MNGKKDTFRFFIYLTFWLVLLLAGLVFAGCSPRVGLVIKTPLYQGVLAAYSPATARPTHIPYHIHIPIVSKPDHPLATATSVAVILPNPTQAPTQTLEPDPTTAPYPSETIEPSPNTTPLPSKTPQLWAPIRFAVIGDYGSGDPQEEDVADLVKSWQPDFIITTGDNNYPDGNAAVIDEHIGQFYHDFIYPYSGTYGAGAAENFFFPTLGNHDWMAENAQPYLDYFTLPGNERYYDFVWGPVHFFAIDMDDDEPDGYRSDSLQAQWLQERLSASTTPWQLVYLHLAPYSSGNHGSSVVAQWPYEDWGADAVLAGHDHDYERLFIGGIPYFVNGLGGGARYLFQETPVAGSQVRFRDDWGAMLVSAAENEIRFQFITQEGIVIDDYTLLNPNNP